MLTAYGLLSKKFRGDFAGTLRHFQTFVMADYPRWLAKPNVVLAKDDSRKTLIVDYRPPQRLQEREAMTFIRENGAWKLLYDFYLANRLTAK